MSASIRSGSMKLLSDVPACELALASRDLIYIDTKTTVDETLQLMKKNNILALPVFDDQQRNFIGMAHIADLMKYVAFFGFKGEQVSPTFQNGTIACANLLGLDAESKDIWIASITDNLDVLLEYFTKGVHRVLVRLPIDRAPHDSSSESLQKVYGDATSDLRMVTQTDLVHFLCKHMTELKEQCHLVNRTIQELGLMKKVECMLDTDTALSGFAKMSRENISSLAIVDKEGVLKGTLSSSDLRGLTSNLIQRVLLPVTQFIMESHHGYVPRPHFVQVNHTLAEALQQMIFARVHRLWVVDGITFKPLGVVSMTDALAKIYSNDFVVPNKIPI